VSGQQDTRKKIRGFAERAASRANYVVWHRATTAAFRRWLRRSRPQPVPPIGEEVASAVTASASVADDVAAGVAASRFTGSVPRRIGQQGVVAGVAGVLAGATAEAVRDWRAFKKGDLPPVELARKMAATGSRSGVGMGARSAGAAGLQELAIVAATRIGSIGLKRAVRSNVAAGVAFAAVEQTIDTVHLARGKIDTSEYGSRSAQTAGATGGALGGVALGAALGSVVPFVGSTAGAVIGGIVGGAGGGVGGRRLGDAMFAPKPKDAVEAP
jgi:hypothetical protein